MEFLKLPGGERAVVDIEKLSGYCLSAVHRDGKHKARTFASALHVTAADAVWLRERLLDAAKTKPATPSLTSRFGDQYVLDFLLETRRGAAMVRSAWIIRYGEDFSPACNLLSTKETGTMKTLPLLALVALPEDIPEHKLSRGQMGTVVEHLQREGERAFLVEFSDEDGETIAMLPLQADQVIVLHKNSEAA